MKTRDRRGESEKKEEKKNAISRPRTGSLKFCNILAEENEKDGDQARHDESGHDDAGPLRLEPFDGNLRPIDDLKREVFLALFDLGHLILLRQQDVDLAQKVLAQGQVLKIDLLRHLFHDRIRQLAVDVLELPLKLVETIVALSGVIGG